MFAMDQMFYAGYLPGRNRIDCGPSASMQNIGLQLTKEPAQFQDGETERVSAQPQFEYLNICFLEALRKLPCARETADRMGEAIAVERINQINNSVLQPAHPKRVHDVKNFYRLLHKDDYRTTGLRDYKEHGADGSKQNAARRQHSVLGTRYSVLLFPLRPAICLLLSALSAMLIALGP